MNDFDFILQDVIFEKDVKLTEDEYWDICLALRCTSEMYKDTGEIEHKRKSRNFLRLREKLMRC